MTRRPISTGSPFEALSGDSRAVVQGNRCFVAGVTDYDHATMELDDAIAARARACCGTVPRVRIEAGSDFGAIVRVTHDVADRALLDGLGPVPGEVLGDVRPAAAVTIAALTRPEMRREVGVTAFRGS